MIILGTRLGFLFVVCCTWQHELHLFDKPHVLGCCMYKLAAWSPLFFTPRLSIPNNVDLFSEFSRYTNVGFADSRDKKLYITNKADWDVYDIFDLERPNACALRIRGIPKDSKTFYTFFGAEGEPFALLWKQVNRSLETRAPKHRSLWTIHAQKCLFNLEHFFRAPVVSPCNGASHCLFSAFSTLTSISTNEIEWI